MEQGILRAGDTVRVREWDDLVAEYGFRGDPGDRIIDTPNCCFPPPMRVSCGKILTIRSVARQPQWKRDVLYFMEPTGTGCTFTNYMVEKYPAIEPLDGDPIPFGLLFDGDFE